MNLSCCRIEISSSVGALRLFVLGWALTYLCNQPLIGQTPTSLGLQGESISSVVLDGNDANTIYAGSYSDFTAGKTGGIFRTTDGGASWDTLIRGVTVVDLDVHPLNNQVIYATLGLNLLTMPGIMKSTDGGTNWAYSSSGIILSAEEGPMCLAIDPLAPETVYVGTGGYFGGRFYRSTNGGSSWASLGDTTRVRNGVISIAVNPFDRTEIFAGTAGSGDLMRSTDFGTTWQETGFQAFVVQIVFGADPSTVYLASYCTNSCTVGVFQSTDGGQSWQNPNQGLPDTLNVKSISLRGNAAYLAGNKRDSTWIFHKIIDIWEPLVTNVLPPVNTIFVAGDILYMGGQGVAVLDLPSLVFSRGLGPESSHLVRNFPNPFNPYTRIRYRVPESGTVFLAIYDNLGRFVRRLVLSPMSAGEYEIDWDSRGGKGQTMTSGVYYCVLRMKHYVGTVRMILLR